MKRYVRMIVESPGNYTEALRPSDIDISDGLPNTFGKSEVEAAAEHLVIFCQKRGGWYPFTIEELLNFYKMEKFNTQFMLFGLLGHWWDDGMLCGGVREDNTCLVAGGDGLYYFTNIFTKRIEKHSRYSHQKKEVK